MTLKSKAKTHATEYSTLALIEALNKLSPFINQEIARKYACDKLNKPYKEFSYKVDNAVFLEILKLLEDGGITEIGKHELLRKKREEKSVNKIIKILSDRKVLQTVWEDLVKSFNGFGFTVTESDEYKAALKQALFIRDNYPHSIFYFLELQSGNVNVCDGKCNFAFGKSKRPKNEQGNYLTDSEIVLQLSEDEIKGITPNNRPLVEYENGVRKTDNMLPNKAKKNSFCNGCERKCTFTREEWLRKENHNNDLPKNLTGKKIRGLCLSLDDLGFWKELSGV